MSRALSRMIATVCCGLLAFALRGAGLPPLPEGEDCFTIAVFGDTQMYTEQADGSVVNPSFKTRIDWLSDPDNIRAQNIVFLCHQGDIVDRRTVPAQWKFANDQMSRLDDVLPYAICPGNHDVSGTGDASEFCANFPASRFTGKSWYGGSFAGCTYGTWERYGNNANSYQLLESGGMKLILFHLQCNTGRPVLDWMDGLLERHADRKAIIVTHQYLGRVLETVPESCKEMSQRLLKRMRWSKVSSTTVESVGPCEAWQTCFSQHTNVIMVLCGDQSEALSYRQSSVGVHGNTVHEICMDYPHADNSDWIRLYRFFPKRNKVEAYTYSPQANALCTSAGYCKDVRFHRFDLELDDGTGRISDVFVRQDWPWDGRIRVEYTLHAQKGGRYDVTPTVTCEGAAVAVPSAAVSGDVDGVESGRRALFLDAAQLDFGGRPKAALSVSLAVTPVAGADDEPVYRLVSLDGSRTFVDLTRADIRSGNWGSWLEDPSEYVAWVGKAAKPAALQARDVFAWTGVTNGLTWRRDWMVLRRIPSGQDFLLTESNITARLTKDYWMGVFEYTQGQFERVYEVASNLQYSAPVSGGDEAYHRPMWFTNATCAAGRPVDYVTWVDIRGSTGNVWPADGEAMSSAKILGQLRKVTGLAFDLPTELQWTAAARAQSTTDFCTGYGWYSSDAEDCIARLGRYQKNGGFVDGHEPDRACTAECGTAVVGSYAPNIWGLYDVHGNVAEWVLDRGSSIARLQELAAAQGGVLVDSPGDPDGSVSKRMLMNGRYGETKSRHRLSARTSAAYNDRETALGVGCRFCLPFNALDRVPGLVVSVAKSVTVDVPSVRQWRTAPTPTVTVPSFWPDRSALATLSVTTNGVAVRQPVEIARQAGSLVDDIAVDLPAAADPETECVVDLALTFRDVHGNELATQTARLGVVEGADGASPVPARNPSRKTSWRRVGRSAVLPVDDATDWFWWTPIAEGDHEVSDGDRTVRLRCGSPGYLLQLR